METPKFERVSKGERIRLLIEKELVIARKVHPGKHPSIEHSFFVLQAELNELHLELLKGGRSSGPRNNKKILKEAIETITTGIRLLEDWKELPYIDGEGQIKL